MARRAIPEDPANQNRRTLALIGLIAGGVEAAAALLVLLVFLLAFTGLLAIPALENLNPRVQVPVWSLLIPHAAGQAEGEAGALSGGEFPSEIWPFSRSSQPLPSPRDIPCHPSPRASRNRLFVGRRLGVYAEPSAPGKEPTLGPNWRWPDTPVRHERMTHTGGLPNV